MGSSLCNLHELNTPQSKAFGTSRGLMTNRKDDGLKKAEPSLSLCSAPRLLSLWTFLKAKRKINITEQIIACIEPMLLLKGFCSFEGCCFYFGNTLFPRIWVSKSFRNQCLDCLIFYVIWDTAMNLAAPPKMLEEIPQKSARISFGWGGRL